MSYIHIKANDKVINIEKAKIEDQYDDSYNWCSSMVTFI